MALLFEHVTCGRCGGSGRFGPTSVHNGVCFKCNGMGQTLTKRGKVAQAYLNELRARPASELKVGDKILYEGFACGSIGMPSKWVEVTAIEPRGDELSVTASGVRFIGPPDMKMRVALDGETRKRLSQQALDFQATLTKTGTVRKVRKEQQS